MCLEVRIMKWLRCVLYHARHYRLKEKIFQLNKNRNISPTPEGTVGVQQSLEERLVMCVERLVTMYLGLLSQSTTQV